MKAQKRKVLTDLLQNQEATVCLDALSEIEKTWLNDRAFEINNNVIRVICTSQTETEQAREIFNKITGAKVRITRTIIEVSTEAARENLKTLMN